MFAELSLKEWNGIVLDIPSAELIPVVIQEEIGPVGDGVLWKYQRASNDTHSFKGIGEESMIEEQNEARVRLAEAFSTQFPNLVFVIETSWLDDSTWYQPSGDAPVTDEPWQEAPIGYKMAKR